MATTKVCTRKDAQPTTDLHHWEDDSKHLVTKFTMFVQVADAGVLLEHPQPRPVRDCQRVTRPGAGTNGGWRRYCWSILPDERLARVVHGAFSRGTTRVSHRGLVLLAPQVGVFSNSAWNPATSNLTLVGAG
ncbi:hypothetical protein M404DRAFT_429329 [Pisolithus tinctorius Marx 270]|uniref:Uncharacterized protein n=1 Tax=Pisolithus tinctorius Marx 270 TaxID=870435 RepID=A0A0C3P262_PISTI|nr:hypothetical protein M404DRAFT_429329 [Pisolithus tinctorius Marx 270]